MSLLFIVSATVLAGKTVAADDKYPTPLPRAHAHNDYEHSRPLFDALSHRFNSVEADIFLVRDKMLVGHDVIDLRKGRTLEKLYLDPLRRRVEENGGRVYKDGPEFLLMIDFKNTGEKTFFHLHKVLEKYREMLTEVRDGKLIKRAVRIVISGDRPVVAISRAKNRLVGIDGRLSDLDSSKPAHLMPMISDRWGRHFKWRGEGPMPKSERKKLEEIVRKAHAKGRIVRFWATPEKVELWKVLYEVGVDRINTDDLEGLEKFLATRDQLKRGPKKPAKKPTENRAKNERNPKPKQ